MIGFLTGKIISKNPDTLQCILLAHRTGYEITLPRRTLDSLLLDQKTSLWIHTHVREDQLNLFGFISETEKQFFRLLLSVSGLGPKTALSLISEHGASRLAELIIKKEAKQITEAQGVGKKLADKIILELAAKLEKLVWVGALQTSDSKTSKTKSTPVKSSLKEELSSALTYLGYTPSQIKNGLEKLFMNSDLETANFESALKMALNELSGRGISHEVTANG